jgi:hypothetical protein
VAASRALRSRVAASTFALHRRGNPVRFARRGIARCESGIEVLDATQVRLFHVNDRREHHRGRDLRHDHHRPDTAELQAAAAGRGLLEPIAHAARDFHRRHDAGDGGARHRQHDRDGERTRGKAEIEPEGKAAQVGLEKHRAPGAKRNVGSGDAHDRRDTAKDQRFSEHLRHDAPRLAPSAVRTTRSASRDAARANSSRPTLPQIRISSTAMKK